MYVIEKNLRHITYRHPVDFLSNFKTTFKDENQCFYEEEERTYTPFFNVFIFC